MTDNACQEDESKQESDEKPQIYSVKKDLTGWQFSRREFLAATAVAAVTAATANATMAATNEPNTTTSGGLNNAIPIKVILPVLRVVKPGESFTQIWQFTNNSESVWCKGARLHLDSDQMQVPMSIPVPDLAPGQTVFVTADLVAPSEAGTYQNNWHLQAADSFDPGVSSSFIVMSDPISPPIESPHPYDNSMDQTWTVTNPDINAQYTRVHFSQVNLETNYDHIYLRDGTGQLAQSITGYHPTGLWSASVPGREVQIELVTDSSVTNWGFSLDQIETCQVVFMPVIRRDPTPTPTPTPSPTPCPCHGVCGCHGNTCTCNTIHYWYPN